MLNAYGEVAENVSLENYNTYGIKTYCKYLIKPNSCEDLQNLITYLNGQDIKYLVLGKGSNVILPDSKFEGVIINLEKLNNIKINNEVVEVEAGALLSKLVQVTVNSSLKGLEVLASIPGTVGGALYGNAGFKKDQDIYSYLDQITVLRDNKIISLQKKQINYSYRYTEFKDKKDIILKAVFKLEKGNKEQMAETINNNREHRRNTQPLEFKNAGSVFRNPPDLAAGKLIEEAGLKGVSIGGAEISSKHANFIINKGNATSEDIKKLIDLVQKTVYEKYNIKLELEQNIIEW